MTGWLRQLAWLTRRRRTGASVMKGPRAAWGRPLLEQIGQDVRYAVRTLSRSPAFTFAAVLTLAFGIGLTTAIFSIVRGVLLRPLPFDEPGQLVMLRTITESVQRNDAAFSPPNFASLREESRSFTDVVAITTSEQTLVGAGEARRIESAHVSAGFFELLGVRPVLGRTFHAQQNQPGQERVVVLGHALWQQQFGGDPAIVGRTIRLEGQHHLVLGVMPAGFDYPGARELWVPQLYDRGWSSATAFGRKRNLWVPAIARLRPDVSLETARAELGAIGRRLQERFPETNAGVRFTAMPLHDEIVGDVRTPLLVLFGAVALVLFIACANVAGLLLARMASRSEEIAVRAALGAGRARIVRQLVIESLVLGCGGGLLGVALAFWATGELVAARPGGIPRLDAVQVDGGVLTFAVAVTVLAGLLAGTLPALRATGDGLGGAIQSGGRTGLSRQRGQRARSALVVGQLAVAVVLLVCAGLLLRSFARLTAVAPGFRTERMLSFYLALPGSTYGSNERIETFFGRLLDRVTQHPGVRSAGAISRLPVAAGGLSSRFHVEGRPPVDGNEPSISVRAITPEYFRTMGVTLLRGVNIGTRDRAGSPANVVINETAAKQFFPGEDPIGRRLVAFSYDPVENASDAFTIVGVVADVRSRGLSVAPPPEAYFAHALVPLNRMFVVVRSDGDPLTLTASIRRELAALDPDLPVPSFQTLEQVLSDSLARPRYFTTLLGGFSALALTLAAIGIFGLLSFAVAQRTHEIGVRIALGASPATLVGTIVREALTLVAIGAAIGLAAALWLTRVLENQLFEVSRTDPLAFAGVTCLLAATAFLASLVPAWRAAMVDPLVALRRE